MNDAQIIKEIKFQQHERVLIAGEAAECPPTTMAEVLAAEQALGFKLPDLLRRIYTEAANGGFGPLEGVIGLAGGWTAISGDSQNLVELYQSVKSDLKFFPSWQWPTMLLPICENFETLFCIDCSDVLAPVVAFSFSEYDKKRRGWHFGFEQVSSSFRDWLEESLLNFNKWK